MVIPNIDELPKSLKTNGWDDKGLNNLNNNA